MYTVYATNPLNSDGQLRFSSKPSVEDACQDKPQGIVSDHPAMGAIQNLPSWSEWDMIGIIDDDGDLTAVFSRDVESTPYPDGLTGESAFYALDGPKEQKIQKLKRIIDDCDGHDTPEARALGAEAQEYLQELE